MALVAAGVGVAIVPEGVARANPEVAIREIVDSDVSRLVGVAYSETSAPSSALQALLATLERNSSPRRHLRTKPA